MPKIVGISFNKKGRVYNFNAKDFDLKKGEHVIVETEKGLQYGFVVSDVKNINDSEIDFPLRDVLRIASDHDEFDYEMNTNDANNALVRARDIVEKLGLNMNILDANYTFDRKQLLFNFVSDERVDFRELAKKLASIYRTRIELRQIGIRDKAKEIGGLGPCGRMLCCNTFLTDINSVTINMAKNQMLALNPAKINGACGRLLCCLGYEDEVYENLRKNLPEIGMAYNKKGVKGTVVDLDILKQIIYIEDEQNNIVEVKVENGSN